MAEVKVSLVRKSENSPIKVEVALKSNIPSMSGPRWSFKVLDIDSRIERNVEIVGGALAEYQNELYRDNHNPDEVARIAKETFREVMIEHGSGPGKLFIS